MHSDGFEPTYRHFPDRDQLLVAILERLVEVFQHLLVAERDPAVGGEQRNDRRQAVDDLLEVAPPSQVNDAAEVARHAAVEVQS